RAAVDRAARARCRRPGRARLRGRHRAAREEGALVKLVLTLTAAAALALPATAAAQAGKPVVGGGSLNTAPLLAQGSYTDTVAAGETVYWKVRVAKGQVLQVKATVDTSQIETDPTSEGYMKGLVNLDYELNIFSPLREELSKEGGGDYNAASA